MMVYTYRVLLFMDVGPERIEKRLNEVAAEGYRLVESLSGKGGEVFVMEKLVILSTECKVKFAVFEGCRHYVQSGRIDAGSKVPCDSEVTDFDYEEEV